MNGTELNLDFSSRMREILNARGEAILENLGQAARRENVSAEAALPPQGGRGLISAEFRAPWVASAMSDNKATRLLRLIDELAEAAERVGFEVRREKILRENGYRARGGACRLREQELLILDRDQAPADQIEVLAEALRGRDLEQIYLSPAARRVLQTGPE
jgi:hypothetical protein